MGRRTNYELDFYKQFEELNNTIKNLNKKLDEANKLNEKLQNEIDRFKIKEYETVYDNILKKAIKENKHIGSSFYKSKANKLYNRLKKYKKNHFYFI